MSRESVRLFCDASLDDDYVKGQFRQDQFATGEAMDSGRSGGWKTLVDLPAAAFFQPFQGRPPHPIGFPGHSEWPKLAHLD